MTGDKDGVVEVAREDLERSLEAMRDKLTAKEHELVRRVFDSYVEVTQALADKRMTIARLREMLFGAKTEKTADILNRLKDEIDAGNGEGPGGAAGDPPRDKERKPPPRGHGRNGADAYADAETRYIRHETLKPGHRCPECKKGKLYEQAEPKSLIRVTGQAPLVAKRYDMERLRCNLCGEVFTADTPEGVGEEKYDEGAKSVIGVMKYGTGMPFNRLQRLEKGLGLPLPASTQWEIVKEAAENVKPAHDELIRQAAQGEVIHNDDTKAKILAYMGKRLERSRAKSLNGDEPSPAAGTDGLAPGTEGPSAAANPTVETESGANIGAAPDDATAAKEQAASDAKAERTGVYTSGIVSLKDGRKVALYFTGRRHAGENMATVLEKRDADLDPPIRMNDALSRDPPEEFKTLVANCLAHGRRKFVETADDSPVECVHVLKVLREVYRTDAAAAMDNLSPEARLSLHQAESGPRMAALHEWLMNRVDSKLVEPNSNLGKAIAYMDRHWDKLTLFLSVPGAPLDNNIVERALKRAILHRKNSLFFLSDNGARVADIFMSLIHTCELAGENPIHYLTELQRHAKELYHAPAAWMPWSYRDTLSRFAAAAASPASMPRPPGAASI